jgi:hypothetical protein
LCQPAIIRMSTDADQIVFFITQILLPDCCRNHGPSTLRLFPGATVIGSPRFVLLQKAAFMGRIRHAFQTNTLYSWRHDATNSPLRSARIVQSARSFAWLAEEPEPLLRTPQACHRFPEFFPEWIAHPSSASRPPVLEC